MGEEDERDLGVAEEGELVGLLEQAVAALGERHLAADLVLDPLQHHLAATHLRPSTSDLLLPNLSPSPDLPTTNVKPDKIQHHCTTCVARGELGWHEIWLDSSLSTKAK